MAHPRRIVVDLLNPAAEHRSDNDGSEISPDSTRQIVAQDIARRDRGAERASQFVKEHLLGTLEDLRVAIRLETKFPRLGNRHNDRQAINGLPTKRPPVPILDFALAIRIQNTAEVFKESL
jgi:hypothetical protein